MMDARTKNHLTFAGVVILFAIAYLLMQRNEALVTANVGRLDARLDPSRDAVVLSWRSDVEAPMGRRFDEAYQEYADQVSLFIVDLHSPGGALAEGRRVIEVLEGLKQTHELETRVSRGRACASMCVPIYLQGDRRVAARNARFMFHEPTAYDSFTGEPANEPELERRFVADRFFDRYFGNSPMNPAWREWLQSEWVGKDVWKTGKELVDEDSGIITDLE